MSIDSRFYRLSRLHRQIDDALRRESGNPFRRLRLQTLKASVKARLAALMRRPVFAG
jgi:hypothetical protein